MLDNYVTTKFEMDFTPSDDFEGKRKGFIVCKRRTEGEVKMTLRPCVTGVKYGIDDVAEAIVDLFQAREEINKVYVKLSTGQKLCASRTDKVNHVLKEMAKYIFL